MKRLEFEFQRIFLADILVIWIVSWSVNRRRLHKLLMIKGGSSSVAERQLPKLNVAGSIPVSRSNTHHDRRLAKSGIAVFHIVVGRIDLGA